MRNRLSRCSPPGCLRKYCAYGVGKAGRIDPESLRVVVGCMTQRMPELMEVGAIEREQIAVIRGSRRCRAAKAGRRVVVLPVRRIPRRPDDAAGGALHDDLVVSPIADDR